jgi:hypothetical protein
MAFAVIRVVVVSAANQQPGQTWLCLWSSIEQTVCKDLLHILKADRRIFQPLWFSDNMYRQHARHDSHNGRMSCLLLGLRALFTRPIVRPPEASKMGIQDRQELLLTTGFIFQL